MGPSFHFYWILYSHSFEHSQFCNILVLRSSKGWNNASDLRYVISEDDTAKEFDKSDDKCFFLGRGSIVTEPNSHHDGRCPVDTPHVLDVPRIFMNCFECHPVLFVINCSHCQKHWSNKMCKNDIEQNDFEKFVVFFFFETIEKNYLKVS